MITPVYIVLFVFAAIIPALIVVVVCMLRIEALRVDMVTTKHHTDNACQGVADIKTSIMSVSGAIETLHLKFADLTADNHGTRSMVGNLEESVTSLNNKFNSRERVERLAEKRRTREEEQSSPVETVIPGTEQMSMPFALPQQQPQIIPPRRKFGEQPRF